MNSYKKLAIWTLISNFLIVIAGGHGVGTLGLIEGFIFTSLFNHNIAKPITEILWLLLSTAITFIGQIILIISLFNKQQSSSHLKLIGIIILIVGYAFLLIQFWTEPTIGISLFTAIPFLILAILLFFKNFKANKAEEIESS